MSVRVFSVDGDLFGRRLGSVEYGSFALENQRRTRFALGVARVFGFLAILGI